MKYLSLLQIRESIEAIGSINQFFGFTFLASKQIPLPVGETISIRMDAVTQSFLNEYYRVDPRSEYFFRIFKFNNNDKNWLTPKYPSTGLQKLNMSIFRQAFLHETGSTKWGWERDYVTFLASKLNNGEQIPAYHFAVWFFRNRAFDDYTTQAMRENFYLPMKLFLK
jgi:hypothetical protein